MGKNQHVTYNSEKNLWNVKGAGNSKATLTFNTQLEAKKAATIIAKNQNSEVFIHRKDNNRIRERNSFGNDPFPPEG